MSDDSEFRQLVIDSLKDISKKQDVSSDRLYDLHSEFKLHQQDSLNRWNRIEELDKEQNEILAEHQARSIAIQKDVELRDKALRLALLGEGLLDPSKKKNTMLGRIEALELIPKIVLLLGKWIMWISTVAGAIYGLFQLLG